MLSSKIIVFILLAGLLFFTCKKYEYDDPSFHLTTVKKRLSHRWNLEEVIYHGADVTDSVLGYYPGYTIDYRFNFTYEIVLEDIPSDQVFIGTDSILSYGRWDFFDKDIKDMIVRYPNSMPYNAMKHRILRLDKNALWTCSYNYEMTDSTEYRYIRAD